MISKILVATDGSEVAWKSVEYAVELAKTDGRNDNITLCNRKELYDSGLSVAR